MKIYSDGGARGNPGPAAIGVLLCDHSGEPIKEYQEVIGEATNNVAEYTAVIVGLELAKSLGAEEIDYFVDSELVAHQLSGKYRVKTPHIKNLFMQVKEALTAFKRVSFNQVPRTHEKIKYVDKLVNQVLNREGY
ncbi:MAG TPA: ribonuclease HI family protein [bacterium]|nr:ribonuclease HI family protein [bacterium]